jgi:hypothetical protein
MDPTCQIFFGDPPTMSTASLEVQEIKGGAARSTMILAKRPQCRPGSYDCKAHHREKVFDVTWHINEATIFVVERKKID